jgi:hypothetical protein
MRPVSSNTMMQSSAEAVIAALSASLCFSSVRSREKTK